MRIKMAPKIRVVLIGCIAIVGLGLGAWLAIRFWPHRYHGLLLEPANPVADFALLGPDSRPVRLSDFRGKLTVLYFGYTWCPDVCPTTLAELARGLGGLGRRADQVQVLMITVDPERDTPEVLARYLANFDARFIGLSGTAEQIAAAATPLGIYFEKHAGTAATGYLVDHTATIAVIDQDGYLRLVFPPNTPGEDIASDLSHLLK